MVFSCRWLTASGSRDIIVYVKMVLAQWRGKLIDPWEQLNTEILDCRLCPRLVDYRETVATTRKRAFRDFEYWGRPLTGIGERTAELLIIGLAPAAHGGNRTGRMFTGDSSADWLMRALYRAGFANQPTSRDREDGLVLQSAFITAVARCAPPDNRPTRDELTLCRLYLQREIDLLAHVHVVVTLGQIAFDGYLRALRERGNHVPRLQFAHGARYEFDPPLPDLLVSYHPSRQNTQTGRLTEAMLDQIFGMARQLVDQR